MFVRIFTVAGGEFRGILRSHPFRLFLPVSAGVVLIAPFFVLFAFQSRDAMVAQVGVSTAAFFAVLLGLLAGAAALARERQGALRDLLLSRPLSAAEYVAGKWLGITAAGGLAVVVLSVVHMASVAIRGGPTNGYIPLAAALLLAAFQGSLAAAIGLLFSALLRPGPAFVAALGFVLVAHSAVLVGDSVAGGIIPFLVPRLPYLNLAQEAAFGPFPIGVFGLALLHATLYTAFLLALAAPLAARTAGRAE